MAEAAPCLPCSSSKNWSSADVIRQINSRNAKLVAVVVVVGFMAYHGILHAMYGIESCTWLLSDGMYKGSGMWQPYGCMMHHYSEIDARRCFRYIAYWGNHTHFAFVGDSRVRQLYYEMLRRVQPDNVEAVRARNLKHKPHSDLKTEDAQLQMNLEFLWRPKVNASMIETFQNWQTSRSVPSVIVVGSGTWTIRDSNGSSEALVHHTSNLTQLAVEMGYLASKYPNIKVLWMLQQPVVPEKLPPERMAITNERIDRYNKVAMEVFSHTGAISKGVRFWSSPRLVAQGNLAESVDGIHWGPRALGHNTQMLLNMYCNDHMNYEDGTCCSSREPVTTLQAVTFAVLGVCVVIAVVAAIRVHVCPKRQKTFPKDCEDEYIELMKESSTETEPKIVMGPTNDYYVLIKSLAKLALIMAYFFLCDRTNFFMKENKYFTPLNFWLPVAYIFALGLFFTEESRFTRVLHRDETNEWKGWMQMVILIYHMTGASSVLPIYVHVRVLVSAYLFLTGYGHFFYFWQTGDTGIVRFLQVMFRMNLMAIMLCLCMNRPYQFYYFVPLVSFWFLVAYILLALPPHVTAASADANPLHYLYLVLKFAALFGVVTILYMSEVFFMKVFVTRPWKALFVTTDDDIHEWWFRWKLDRYSVMYGMAFGLAYVVGQRYGLLEDANHGNLFTRPGIALGAVTAAILGITAHASFSFACRNKPECNEVHPYVAFVPILGYVILRNVSGALRTRHSTFFSWFGRISLELMVGQCHVWLAADTHGTLVLVPSYPVANAIVTTFIFMCVAHEMNQVTNVLVNYAVPHDWKAALRNLVLFLLVLVPIGVHDGMF